MPSQRVRSGSSGVTSNWPYRAPKFTSVSRPVGILAHMKSSHSNSHCHVYSSRSHSNSWYICVPVPMHISCSQSHISLSAPTPLTPAYGPVTGHIIQRTGGRGRSTCYLWRWIGSWSFSLTALQGSMLCTSGSVDNVIVHGSASEITWCTDDWS